MKKYLMTVFVILSSTPSWAAWLYPWDASIECNLSVTDEEYAIGEKWPAVKSFMDQLRSLKAERLSINSKTNKMTLHLKDGTIEDLDPIIAKNKGLFGEHSFGSRVSPVNGTLFVKSPTIGEIYMTHRCSFGTVPFDNCQTRGRSQAGHSLVRLNIEGQVIHLDEIYGNENDGRLPFVCTRLATYHPRP